MTAADNNEMSMEVAVLAEKAMAGNRLSFQELVNMFQEDIYRLVYYRTFSQMDAEDVTQEVFVQAFRKLKSLKDTQKFRAWLYTIAVNRCNDFLRKKKYLSLLRLRTAREQEFMEVNRESSNSYDESIAKEKFWKQVKLLLDKLSAMEREVFTLRFMDHLNLMEIAIVLNKSESTVKTHLYRALDKIRKDADFFEEYRESML
jgi:RNA polymerase sigma-70 factor (ECF subfamily)